MARFAFLLIITAVALPARSVHGEQVANRRPAKIWNRTGPLDETPKHVSDAYPLSDQDNKAGWFRFEPMWDEFATEQLDLKKWTVGMHWWPRLPSGRTNCWSPSR